MSGAAAATAATAATAVATDVLPVKKSKKKLIVIVAVLAVLLAAGAGGAVFVLKKRAAAAAAEGEVASGDASDAHAEAPAAEKADAAHAPTFMPLDPFTVNLADRDAERYAQVGITLELTDAKAGDLLKAYMPAIRNNILLALGAKTAGELIERDGKVRLAAEIRREALRPLGYEIELAPEAPAALDAAAPAASKAPVKKKPGKHAASDDQTMPIRAVHFSNFIIQ
jgi:flagellar protein FliL